MVEEGIQRSREDLVIGERPMGKRTNEKKIPKKNKGQHTRRKGTEQGRAGESPVTRSGIKCAKKTKRTRGKEIPFQEVSA